MATAWWRWWWWKLQWHESGHTSTIVKVCPGQSFSSSEMTKRVWISASSDFLDPTRWAFNVSSGILSARFTCDTSASFSHAIIIRLFLLGFVIQNCTFTANQASILIVHSNQFNIGSQETHLRHTDWVGPDTCVSVRLGRVTSAHTRIEHLSQSSLLQPVRGVRTTQGYIFLFWIIFHSWDNEIV